MAGCVADMSYLLELEGVAHSEAKLHMRLKKCLGKELKELNYGLAGRL